MDNQVAMGVGDGFADLQEEVQPGPQIERPRINIDRLAIDIFQHQVGAAGRGLAGIQQAGDSGVLERSEYLPFLQESLAERITRNTVLDQLDGGSLFDLHADKIEDIAAAIAANMPERRAADLAKAIPEAIKQRKRERQRPAG